MREDIRQAIFNQFNDGEQSTYPREFPIWKIGKPLSVGITPDGFPFIVWETKNFGSIQVGESRAGKFPQSSIRNDASSAVLLNTFQERMQTAVSMSEKIVY